MSFIYWAEKINDIFLEAQTGLLVLSLILLVIFLISHIYSRRARKAENQGFAVNLAFESSDKKLRRAKLLNVKAFSALDQADYGVIITGQDDKIDFINKTAEKLMKVDRGKLFKSSILELGDNSKEDWLAVPIMSHYKSNFEREIESGKENQAKIFFSEIKISSNTIGRLICIKKSSGPVDSGFILTASHELISPLSQIKWALADLLKNNFSDDQKQAIRKIYDKNEILIQMAGDLLKESDTGKQNLQEFDLAVLAKEVAVFFKEEMARKRMVFLAVFGNGFYVFADKNKIALVLRNLLDNAIKYTNEDGSIKCGIIRNAGKIEFSISDSGIGIPASQKSKIFGKFFRADNAIESKKHGTGMGLSIVKNIIEINGGKVWFDSKEGQGSTFYFTLPAVEKN